MRAPPDPVIVGKAKWRELWRQRLAVTAPMTILWNEHQTLDEKWRDGSTQDYAAIRCAVYNVGGMLDPYLPSVTRMMERAPQVAQKALIGPWTHNSPGYPQPPIMSASRRMPQTEFRAGRGLATHRGSLVASLAARRGQRHHGRATLLGISRGQAGGASIRMTPPAPGSPSRAGLAPDCLPGGTSTPGTCRGRSAHASRAPHRAYDRVRESVGCHLGRTGPGEINPWMMPVPVLRLPAA